MKLITSTNDRNHLRAMWNLYTDLIITGNNQDAQIIRKAIAIAEAKELDAPGKF